MGFHVLFPSCALSYNCPILLLTTKTTLTCITMDMLSNLQQQRIMVDQLRREAAIKRINVSQAIEDIKKFISDHENEDYLLVGFPSQKSNPFREKSSCSVL